MIFHRSVLGDIKKYYSNNIVKFPEVTGDRLWQIAHISENEVRCVDMDGFEIYIDLNEEYNVDFPLPGRAVYQSGPNAWMLSRKPAKQYNRGISSENTQLLKMNSVGKWENVGIAIDRLQQFVDKPAYQDINTINWEELFSAALNPVFSVSKTGMLFCLNKSVGTINNKTKQVSLSSPILTPEVKPLFPTWSFL